MCDDTYSNKSWCIVAQGMFTLREVNQMEREMCNYLDWELTVDDPILTNFELAVKSDFRETRPTYPNYPTTFVSKRAARAEASTSNTPFDEKSNTTSPVPGFATRQNSASSTKTALSTPSTASWSTDSTTPDTPSPSFSNSASPTSSGSPATPVGGPETNPKIRGVDSSPGFGPTEGLPSTVHPLKPKMFAFAIPSGW
jgi:hypothetical protein